MKLAGDADAALFSFCLPGLGQLAQGRFLAGILFLAWAMASGVAAMVAHNNGVPLVLMVPDLLLLTGWSVTDAYRGRRQSAPHAMIS